VLEHEVVRFRKPDGREVWPVLRDIRPIGVELRQMLQRQPRSGDPELLWSKLFAAATCPKRR